MVSLVRTQIESITLDEPRFLAIAGMIEHQVVAGEIARGARLMSERDLCKRFGVSRVTIRRALNELRKRGFVEPDGVRGWFVTSAVGEPNLLMGFSEMARARGLRPSSKVISARVRPATLDESEDLAIAPGADIFELERIRLIDGVAVGHERSRIVLHLAPALPGGDYATASLYDALRRAGAAPHSADYVLQAVGASREDACRLDVQEGSPVLLATATTSTASGRRLELSRSLFRGDRYRFRTTLLAMRPR